MTLPAHTSVVPTEPSFAETNPCQAVSHARCSASSARPMPTAIGSSARRRLCLLLYGRQDPVCRGLQAACTESRRRTLQCQQSAGSDSPHNAAKETEEAVKAKPVDQGEQPVPKAEEQAAAAETNENLATPVPQHMPLASIKSESPPDSRTRRWVVLTHHPRTPLPRLAAAAGATRTATRTATKTTGQTAARRRLSTKN